MYIFIIKNEFSEWCRWKWQIKEMAATPFSIKATRLLAKICQNEHFWNSGNKLKFSSNLGNIFLKANGWTSVTQWVPIRINSNLNSRSIFKLSKTKHRNQKCLFRDKHSSNEDIYKNIWDAFNTMLREKFITLNTYVEKEEGFQINNQAFHVRNQRETN